MLSAGDMGHAVGWVARDRGCRVLTCLAGRSTRTRALAAEAGIEDGGDLASVVGAADILLSILPPAEAPALARAVGGCTVSARERIYVDCNAIAPATTLAIGRTVSAAGFAFVDGGIVGRPPVASPATRLYVSGPAAGRLAFLEDERLTVRDLGPEPGRASAVKMCYAALTKGNWTLFAALSTAAHRLGVAEALDREFSESQGAVRERQRAMLPRLPLDAGRWIGEMEEIAATLDAAGLPDGFHRAAAEMFRLLDGTPFAAESRQDWDRDRTPEQTVAAVSEAIDRLQGHS
ncbi:MAG: DUF1932 domain-containing protein [Rhodospirillaceae bacterium]|nr:DUF1932 domain-containing protein [Rhodospirillaceae bacterium]MDE0617144.1 DUF1932 domain-containing protein [Rhodospirillaceae bacterium]